MKNLSKLLALGLVLFSGACSTATEDNFLKKIEGKSVYTNSVMLHEYGTFSSDGKTFTINEPSNPVMTLAEARSDNTARYKGKDGSSSYIFTTTDGKTGILDIGAGLQLRIYLKVSDTESVETAFFKKVENKSMYTKADFTVKEGTFSGDGKTIFYKTVPTYNFISVSDDNTATYENATKKVVTITTTDGVTGTLDEGNIWLQVFDEGVAKPAFYENVRNKTVYTHETTEDDSTTLGKFNDMGASFQPATGNEWVFDDMLYTGIIEYTDGTGNHIFKTVDGITGTYIDPTGTETPIWLRISQDTTDTIFKNSVAGKTGYSDEFTQDITTELGTFSDDGAIYTVKENNAEATFTSALDSMSATYTVPAGNGVDAIVYTFYLMDESYTEGNSLPNDFFLKDYVQP